jgi:hypothetical protein
MLAKTALSKLDIIDYAIMRVSVPASNLHRDAGNGEFT